MDMTHRWVVVRVRDIRAEFAGKGVNLDRNESKWHIWVGERRIMNGEEVGGKDGKGAIEDVPSSRQSH